MVADPSGLHAELAGVGLHVKVGPSFRGSVSHRSRVGLPPCVELELVANLRPNYFYVMNDAGLRKYIKTRLWDVYCTGMVPMGVRLGL